MRTGKGNTAMVRALNAGRERKRIARLMESARQAERAAIVAWLRNDADCFHPDVERQIIRIADMLERGEHLAHPVNQKGPDHDPA